MRRWLFLPVEVEMWGVHRAQDLVFVGTAHDPLEAAAVTTHPGTVPVPKAVSAGLKRSAWSLQNYPKEKLFDFNWRGQLFAAFQGTPGETALFQQAYYSLEGAALVQYGVVAPVVPSDVEEAGFGLLPVEGTAVAQTSIAAPTDQPCVVASVVQLHVEESAVVQLVVKEAAVAQLRVGEADVVQPFVEESAVAQPRVDAPVLLPWLVALVPVS